MEEIQGFNLMTESNPAFDFLDFLPGSYQDSSIFLDIPTRNPTRNPTRKIMEDYPGNPGILPGNPRITFPILSEFPACSLKFPGFSRIIQDLSGLLLEVLNLQSPRFCRIFHNAVPDFPGSFRVAS